MYYVRYDSSYTTITKITQMGSPGHPTFKAAKAEALEHLRLIRDDFAEGIRQVQALKSDEIDR